jgi:hypothetical protein
LNACCEVELCLLGKYRIKGHEINHTLLPLLGLVVYSIFEAQDKILGPKWDTLQKHGGRRRAKKAIPAKGIKEGQYYTAHNYRHLVNERLYAARQVAKPITVLLREVKGERARKRQQMGTIFHLLAEGRPMTTFEGMRSLLQFLGCPRIPTRHWSDNSRWSMAQHMEL